MATPILKINVKYRYCRFESSVKQLIDKYEKIIRNDGQYVENKRNVITNSASRISCNARFLNFPEMHKDPRPLDAYVEKSDTD